MLKDGEVVGVVSSGGYGHHVDKSIAMVFLNPDLDDTTDLSVEILGEMRPAQVVKESPFDPENARLRG